MNNPLFTGVEPRDPLARVRVLDESLAVPHDPADVHLIIQDPVSALGAAIDRRKAPRSAGWSWYAGAVQPHGNLLRRHSDGVITKHASHHLAFNRIDRAVAANGLALRVEALHDIVTVRIPTAGLPIYDPAPQSAPDLVRQILEEECVHRALQPNVQRCHVSFGERNHFHVREGETLEEASDILLIAREPIHRFGEDDVETSAERIRDERLDAWAQEGGAGNGLVRIFLHDMPALLLSVGPADAELISDRSIALIVGRITGVERDLHGTNPTTFMGEVRGVL